ncbi:uncharacterized protein [Epargyreus clarus]|uniref:uncharacterized protein n=1 Tax=Epargyreus clarus TaxID=520877 RepID=UPI003C2C46B3
MSQHQLVSDKAAIMADAESVLRDLIDKLLQEKQCKQKDLKMNAISTEGANYTSAVYTITLTTDKEILELFAKVAIIAGEMRKHMNADTIYETERIVYTKLVKVYETIQDKHNLPEEHRYVFPKCYAIESELGKETVIMENLAAKGYKPCSRFNSMDWEHAALSVEVLAKFHALSFAYAKEYPEEFEELAAKLVYKAASVDKDDETIIALWVKMVERALDVIDEKYKPKIRDMMMEDDVFNKFNTPIGKPVMSHGDYRLSNILYRREGKTLKAIPVDYQLVHGGCPATDLIYLIFLGTDEEFRKQYYDQLLDHYYQHLCQALRRLDVDPVEVYPRETFDSHMQKRLPYALFLGVAILPIVVVEAESAPKMSEDIDLQSFIVEPNALYASRFRGVVNDCVRRGAL